eukprot:1158728-Pelagomonas_calceolata.AAC.9
MLNASSNKAAFSKQGPEWRSCSPAYLLFPMRHVLLMHVPLVSLMHSACMYSSCHSCTPHMYVLVPLMHVLLEPLMYSSCQSCTPHATLVFLDSPGFAYRTGIPSDRLHVSALDCMCSLVQMQMPDAVLSGHHASASTTAPLCFVQHTKSPVALRYGANAESPPPTPGAVRPVRQM